MSYWSKKIVLNDSYKCWKIQEKSFNLINLILVLVKDFCTLTPQNQFYKALS
jgi:hypothetical protein